MKLFINSSIILLFVFITNHNASGTIIRNSCNTHYSYSVIFKQKLPKIELFLGDAASGQKINRSNFTLNLKVVNGDTLPKSTTLKVEKWLVSIEGIKTPYSGTGNTLSKDVINEIKSAEKGIKITISIIYDIVDFAINKPLTSVFLSNPRLLRIK